LPPKRSSIERREILLVGGAGGLGAATAALLEAEGAYVVISSLQRGLRADINQASDRKWLLDAVPKLYGLVVFPAKGDGPMLLARDAKDRMTSGIIVLNAAMPSDIRNHLDPVNLLIGNVLVIDIAQC
jgi:nucleoside-diphosphate-sugar epimerase